MKENKKEMNVFFLLALCLTMVGGVAYGLNFLKNNFEQSNIVVAENLPALPSQIKQNQIREIINNGYLEDGSFYTAK